MPTRNLGLCVGDFHLPWRERDCGEARHSHARIAPLEMTPRVVTKIANHKWRMSSGEDFVRLPFSRRSAAL